MFQSTKLRKFIGFQSGGGVDVVFLIPSPTIQVVKLFWAIDEMLCGNDWRINNVKRIHMTEEVHLGMSWSIHHLFLSVEGLRASREKSLWCQTSASMDSVTGCSSILSSEHLNGYETWCKSWNASCMCVSLLKSTTTGPCWSVCDFWLSMHHISFLISGFLIPFYMYQMYSLWECWLKYLRIPFLYPIRDERNQIKYTVGGGSSCQAGG